MGGGIVKGGVDVLVDLTFTFIDLFAFINYSSSSSSVPAAKFIEIRFPC